MTRIGLFYGSSTGNTERAAGLISAAFGAGTVTTYNIAQSTPKDLMAYDVLILGVSTWGHGDLQDDWDAFPLNKVDFSGRTVALYGLGDQSGFPDTFVDGMGMLYERVIESGGTVIGGVPRAGYTATQSRALIDDAFVGLALDDDNQSNLTAERIGRWVSALASRI